MTWLGLPLGEAVSVRWEQSLNRTESTRRRCVPGNSLRGQCNSARTTRRGSVHWRHRRSRRGGRRAGRTRSLCHPAAGSGADPRAAGQRQLAGYLLAVGRQAVTGKTGQTKSKDLAAGQESCSERREPLTVWPISGYDVNEHLAASPDVPKSEDSLLKSHQVHSSSSSIFTSPNGSPKSLRWHSLVLLVADCIPNSNADRRPRTSLHNSSSA